ncbi:hypothetical protein GCM10017687_53660 [Streptomyces echinatus]
MAGVAVVGPEVRQPPKVLLRRGQQNAGGVPVGRGGRRDQHGQQESERVGEQVPLAPVDLGAVSRISLREWGVGGRLAAWDVVT